MTHKVSELKKVIEAEAEGRYNYKNLSAISGFTCLGDTAKRLGESLPLVKLFEEQFTAGCNFMAGHLDGLLEWVMKYWCPTEDNTGWMQSKEHPDYKKSGIPDISVYSHAELKDKYFNELNSKG